MRIHAKYICSSIFLLLVIIEIAEVKARSLKHIVSDGVDEHINVQLNHSNYLLLPQGKLEMEYSSSSSSLCSSSEECEQLYGFLPCSNNGIGHLFLIVVYEYLLFNGESYVASGGKRIFNILGPGKFGASAFNILVFLPESMILLVSGLSSTEEAAQEYVYTGVGMLAGSTILLLTLLWGTCVIIGSRDYSNGSNPENGRNQGLLSQLANSGISIDSETMYTAKIMALSVIPFIIMQLPKIFPMSSEESFVILIALVVSVVSLFTYFYNQFSKPWIQERRLYYVNHEVNAHDIRRFFKQIDQNGDDCILFSELEEFLQKIKFRKLHIHKDKSVIEEVIKQLDRDGDNIITNAEFIDGIEEQLKEAKLDMDTKYHSSGSSKQLYEVLIEAKRKEHETRKVIMSEILRHVQSYALGSLLKPDEDKIKRLFGQIDRDGDSTISLLELKEMMMDIKNGKILLDPDEAVSKVMEEFDKNGDYSIDEEEFIAGISKWLDTSNNQDDNHQKTGEKSVDKSLGAWVKAIMLLFVGIVILALLAEPLIKSVQKFSKAASIPSFFIAFILVPLATNARIATSAITSSRCKEPKPTSLTFSEICNGVFMNNILGFSVLLSIIFLRNLTWDFSSEVLVVLIVCALVGLIAGFHSTFPVWTSSLSYLLYPVSLVLVYLLNVLQYS